MVQHIPSPKALTKQQSLSLYAEIIRLLKSKEPKFIILKKHRGVHGKCKWTALLFDWRKDIVRTVIHECVHYLRPKWSESAVLYAESKVANVITPFQAAKLIKVFAQKAYTSELQRLRSANHK